MMSAPNTQGTFTMQRGTGESLQKITQTIDVLYYPAAARAFIDPMAARFQYMVHWDIEDLTPGAAPTDYISIEAIDGGRAQQLSDMTRLAVPGSGDVMTAYLLPLAGTTDTGTAQEDRP